MKCVFFFPFLNITFTWFLLAGEESSKGGGYKWDRCFKMDSSFFFPVNQIEHEAWSDVDPSSNTEHISLQHPTQPDRNYKSLCSESKPDTKRQIKMSTSFCLDQYAVMLNSSTKPCIDHVNDIWWDWNSKPDFHLNTWILDFHRFAHFGIFSLWTSDILGLRLTDLVE